MIVCPEMGLRVIQVEVCGSFWPDAGPLSSPQHAGVANRLAPATISKCWYTALCKIKLTDSTTMLRAEALSEQAMPNTPCLMADALRAYCL